MDTFFKILLVFVPLTIGAEFAGVSPVLVFFLAAVSIIPLAKFIGEATEELSSRTNPAIGGLLNATFGNAPELIIGLFALNAGLVEVVKASITGSIVGNLLLVLGGAMFAGGWGKDKQNFNRTGALAGGSTLFLAVIALVVPAIFVITAPGVGDQTVENLSVFVSLALLLMYGASLIFSLHTHKHLYVESEVAKFEPKWSLAKSIGVLLVATLAVAWVSEILVGSIEPLVASFGWTQLFVGVIFVAIIGNAAEHYSAITVALKNRMDLALGITIGSAAQIAMFAAPVLVLASLALGHPMNLVFNLFELVSIVVSVLIVNMIVQDGESNWLEGAQLLAAYVIVALAFFFHP
ncbi:MAG TPA: calcium/proton exchanger [Candidatus Paceibacterota bacterium]|jgi:Ca2+:H+ antiporter|nr:calcium/proton exchanger [Candidatus Paceibacterota bacterium]